VSGIDRPDWADDGPPSDVPAPAVRQQSISRPDWSTEAPIEVQPSPERQQSIPRPDWEQTPPHAEGLQEDHAEGLQEDHAEGLQEDHAEGLQEDHIGLDSDVLERASDRAGLLVADMTEQQVFIDSFDALPAGAKNSIYEGLAAPEAFSRPATNTEMAEWQTVDAGAEMIKQWGHDAPGNVGLVEERMHQMLETMAPDERSDALEWFKELPSEQTLAVLRALAE